MRGGVQERRSIAPGGHVAVDRARLLSGAARNALMLRAVLCERALAHLLHRGRICRTWLRGRDNVAKRYLIHVAGHHLGRLMRALFGAELPRAAADLRLLRPERIPI